MKALLISLLLSAAPGRAASPLESLPNARAEAEMRLAGAQLVEIEAFSDSEGDIDCGTPSFSRAWHFKFYSEEKGSWLIVNACGDAVINTAGHRPLSMASEPVAPLPRKVIDGPSALGRLKAAGLYSDSEKEGERDTLLTARFLDADGDRPAGCYWSAARGRAKAYVACDSSAVFGARQAAKPDGATAGGKQPPPGRKDADTARPYVGKVVSAASARYPGATLVAIEGLTDRWGSVKCVEPDDGWTFTFASPAMKTPVRYGGCKGKVADLGIDFDGRYKGSRTGGRIGADFKDSAESLAVMPRSCLTGRSTFSMKLLRYSRGSPVAGREFIWSVDCGPDRHYADAVTGAYLGKGGK